MPDTLSPASRRKRGDHNVTPSRPTKKPAAKPAKAARESSAAGTIRSFIDLPPRATKGNDLYNVVIETPKGSRSKLDYDPSIMAFRLGSIMPEGMAFPFDFGFVPGTLAPDGDPLDVLLLMESPTPPGVVVAARLVGVIEAVQTEEGGKSTENDRLIAVTPASPLYRNITHLSELPTELCEQIEHFFVTYNAEHGKKFELKGMHGPKRARKCVKRARRNYKGK